MNRASDSDRGSAPEVCEFSQTDRLLALIGVLTEPAREPVV